MILIIGGAFQGKAEFAGQLTGTDTDEFLDGAVCNMEEVFRAGVIVNFHCLIKRLLKEKADLTAFEERLLKENPEVVIISNELGYGVVPMDAADREWREQTGRICTRLAAQARAVYRVVCGIGTRIK